MLLNLSFFFFFFFNDTATTEIYTLSLHDALPICSPRLTESSSAADSTRSSRDSGNSRPFGVDRKSTRLNSSHITISYAVFCLKKKKQSNNDNYQKKKKKKKKNTKK